MLHHHNLKTVVAQLWFLSEGLKQFAWLYLWHMCTHMLTHTQAPTHKHTQLATTRPYDQKSISTIYVQLFLCT
jgi:hypothetical protein